MKPINLQRNQLITEAVMKRPDAIVHVSIQLWEKLSFQLTSIIGEGGFQSLFKRSLHLTSVAFPWMEMDTTMLENNSRFVVLKNCLDGQSLEEAGKANTALLITFIDILALLIGELLTSSILHMAWGDDALNTVVKKELP